MIVPAFSSNAQFGSIQSSGWWQRTRTPYYYGMIIRDGSVMRGYGFFLLPRRPDLATQTVLTTDQLSGQVVLEKSP